MLAKYTYGERKFGFVIDSCRVGHAMDNWLLFPSKQTLFEDENIE